MYYLWFPKPNLLSDIISSVTCMYYNNGTVVLSNFELITWRWTVIVRPSFKHCLGEGAKQVSMKQRGINCVMKLKFFIFTWSPGGGKSLSRPPPKWTPGSGVPYFNATWRRLLVSLCNGLHQDNTLHVFVTYWSVSVFGYFIALFCKFVTVFVYVLSQCIVSAGVNFVIFTLLCWIAKSSLLAHCAESCFCPYIISVC